MSTRRINISRKVYILTSCLLLSIALWFLVTMNNIHTDKVSIPFRFTNVPEDMMVLNDIPSELTVVIQAKGFRLLGHRMMQKWSMLDIDIDPNNELKKSKKDFIILSMRSRLEEISWQLGTDVSIIGIEPDSILVKFDKKSTRILPVKLNGRLGFEKQFGQSGQVVITPDSVAVFGSKKEIQKLDSVPTEFFTINGLRETFRHETNLRALPGINYSETKVEIVVPVEQLTEKVLVLQVKPVSVPGNTEMKLVPDRITVKTLVPISHFNTVLPESFEVVAPFPSESQIILRRVIPQIIRKPPFIQIIQIEPKSLECLILVGK